MGVVWGEGGDTASESGPVTGASLTAWVERLIHLTWRRLLLPGGEA